MKKVIKGNRIKVLDEIEKYFADLPEKDYNKTFQITIDNNRSLEQNNYFHACIRMLAEEAGYEDIELLKKQMKFMCGMYDDHVVETKSGTIINRLYKSTADMSVKELTQFIQKIEIFAIENFNFNFEHLKKTYNE